MGWSKAGNEYVRFDPADVKDGGSGMASWLRLKIHTRESAAHKSEARTCCVCLDDDTQAATKDGWTSTACQHHYHAKCLDNWKTFMKAQGRDGSCPMCRRAIE